MRKYSKLWACSILLSLLLTGCGDVKQINRITFVTCIGIEPSPKGVLIHALSAIPGKYAALAPSGGSLTGKEAPDFILTAEGANISDALYKLKRKSARDIQFGHTKIVLFSSELAKKGLEDQLDFLMRRSEIQNIAWVAVTNKSPEQILRTRVAVPESVSDWMVDMFSTAGSDTFEVLPIYLYQFYTYIREPGFSPYAMVIDTSDDSTSLQITEAAVFRNDKLAGTIPASDVKYLSMLNNRKLASTTLSMKDEKVSFSMLNYKSRIGWKDDHFEVRLDLKLDLDQAPHLNMETLPDLKETQEKLSHQIEEEMRSFIARLQKLRSDPAGFGEAYRLANGGALDKEQWQSELFPEQKVKVQVHTQIQRRGMIK
ncbi:Ger(x)C family spore germination protein [Paenibacillus sp. 32352]|uniref:Ger(x)C family spore germination protein n=1 Tax=Paenibacillus sp. 32352 TaxID=1969111 RepID=UPI0015C4D042|nr:Ger(x)C family spore germination protein [Paenibacillus sp. 32352]